MPSHKRRVGLWLYRRLANALRTRRLASGSSGLPARNPGNGETKGNGGDQMVSMWWVLVAFFGGGCAGILVMALMTIAGGLPEPSAPRIDLSEMPRQQPRPL